MRTWPPDYKLAAVERMAASFTVATDTKLTPEGIQFSQEVN